MACYHPDDELYGPVRQGKAEKDFGSKPPVLMKPSRKMLCKRRLAYPNLPKHAEGQCRWMVCIDPIQDTCFVPHTAPGKTVTDMGTDIWVIGQVVV